MLATTWRRLTPTIAGPSGLLARLCNLSLPLNLSPFPIRHLPSFSIRHNHHPAPPMPSRHVSLRLRRPSIRLRRLHSLRLRLLLALSFLTSSLRRPFRLQSLRPATSSNDVVKLRRRNSPIFSRNRAALRPPKARSPISRRVFQPLTRRIRPMRALRLRLRLSGIGTTSTLLLHPIQNSSTSVLGPSSLTTRSNPITMTV